MVSAALVAMILSGLLCFSSAAEVHSMPGSSIEIVNAAIGPTTERTTGYSLSEEVPVPPYHCEDGHCALASLYNESAKGQLPGARDQVGFPRIGSLIPHGFVAPDIPPPKSA
jgi:hypothetical protein